MCYSFSDHQPFRMVGTPGDPSPHTPSNTPSTFTIASVSILQ
jgi:hypothetical protein